MMPLLLAVSLLAGESGLTLQPGWVASSRLQSPYATQAAAADDRFAYAVSNTHVARHDRQTGKLLGSGTTAGTKHLNSAFVWKGKVYCAHSNYPKKPEESDIRVYDPADDSLKVFHRFDKPPGSLVWCVRDPTDRSWWCCFAHYKKDNAKTFLAKMDDRFQELGRWTFPQKVVADWDGMSASGGIWDGDTLLVSHHHFQVLYRLRLPKAGDVLELVEALTCPFPGQGIAVDPAVRGGLVGIDRAKRAVVFAAPAARRPVGHWPQWRGPDRTNRSSEVGLLAGWPEGGPPLAWKATGLGHGTASVAVTGRRVFTLGSREGQEHLTALDETTGKRLWSTPLGKAVTENPAMRWLGQRTPTVDDDRVYALTARGELVCVGAADGKPRWRKSYPDDLGGRAGTWGFSDRPLVDGDRLICAPGGQTGAVVALDRRTGAVQWRCRVEGPLRSSYAATVVTRAGGVRHYVVFLTGAVVGVSTDGKLLWRYDRIANTTGNNYTPLPHGDRIVLASGYARGVAILEITRTADGLRATERAFTSLSLPPWHEATVLLDELLCLAVPGQLLWLDPATGKPVARQELTIRGRLNFTWADGRLYARNERGAVALLRATPQDCREVGRLQVPGATAKPGSTMPVVAGGRLYLRDDDALFCCDVLARGGKVAGPRPRVHAAAFVPTPPDVVEKMLELAGIGRKDVVYDLGCGDGRILIAAAARHGCKAVGYEMNPDLVEQARKQAKARGVAGLVTIEQKDLFTADLAKADVVALYLTPGMLWQLVPRFKALKAGSRVVTHDFPLPGVTPRRVLPVHAKGGRQHTLYLYTAPLSTETPRPSGRPPARPGSRPAAAPARP